MCVADDGKTTPYFRLERSIRQVDSISAYLFILALDLIIAFIHANLNVGDLQFFNRNILYSACADDTAFFLRNKKLALELINIFLFPGLKIDKEKCEIAGIGVWKRLKVAVLCGMECIDLVEGTIKILGIYVYYNKMLEQ